MNNKKSTKRAFLSSVLSLVLCMAMLIGTTFAWFTDSVTSTGNKIQSGTLKVDLEVLDKGTNQWSSVKESKAAIFNYDLWEPGYTQVKILKVQNEGTLALKWKAQLVSSGAISELANVIDVYVKEDVSAYPTTRNLEGNGWTKLDGTLADFIDTIETTTTGNLAAKTEETLGIAFKMQESAGNTYQGKTLGAFDIRILATQDTVERDSFGTDYDAAAEYEEKGDGPEYSYVPVSAADIATMSFDADNTVYTFSGNFEDLEIETSTGLNQVFDGTNATVSGTVTLKAPGVADNYDGVLKEAKRSGSVKIANFHAEVLNVLAYNNETVDITNNTVKSMSVIGGNFKLNISGNNVDGDFEVYADGQGVNNEYGISLRICDYELSITGNTVTDTYSHAIGINGRQNEEGGAWGTTSSISAFSGNSITVNSTKKTERAALKIWADTTYAKTSGVVEVAAKELCNSILDDVTNVFTIGEGHFKFNMFDVKGNAF